MLIYKIISKETRTTTQGNTVPANVFEGGYEVLCQDKENVYIRNGNDYSSIPHVTAFEKTEYRFFDRDGKEMVFE